MKLGKTQTIDLVVEITKYEAADGKIKFGLCSNFLKELEIGQEITCIHKNVDLVEKPLSSNDPIIMIACGSGIAPFRFLSSSL